MELVITSIDYGLPNFLSNSNGSFRWIGTYAICLQYVVLAKISVKMVDLAYCIVCFTAFERRTMKDTMPLESEP